MLDRLKQDLKNLIGWRSGRKIIVFAVDDYGNVRLASRKAREELDRAGMKVISRFDAYDTLETREDLEMLYEVLKSVKDPHGNSAVFTTYAMSCNIDFESMAKEDYQNYHYELLPQTFGKLAADDPAAYEGAWKLLQEGINEGLMIPQFHGREHFHVELFKDRLRRRDKELLSSLSTRSLASLSVDPQEYPGYTSAFGFRKMEEHQGFEEIIREGLEAFEEVYGYRARNFTPPGGNEHEEVHGYAARHGVAYVDVPMVKKEHQGQGKYKTRFYYTGKRKANGITYMVRNVVFEPTEYDADQSVHHALKQIEAAFRWRRPAIISSHRVNFCGHIDPGNRQIGLNALTSLLKGIVQRWPDVEFMSANQLGDLISKS